MVAFENGSERFLRYLGSFWRTVQNGSWTICVFALGCRERFWTVLLYPATRQSNGSEQFWELPSTGIIWPVVHVFLVFGTTLNLRSFSRNKIQTTYIQISTSLKVWHLIYVCIYIYICLYIYMFSVLFSLLGMEGRGSLVYSVEVSMEPARTPAMVSLGFRASLFLMRVLFTVGFSMVFWLRRPPQSTTLKEKTVIKLEEACCMVLLCQ